MKIKTLLNSAAVLFTATMFNQTAVADTFNLSLSEDTFGIGASFDPLGENSSADISWLHDDDYDLLRAGFYANAISTQSDEPLKQIDVKIGVKGVWLESDFDDGMALPIGAKVEMPVAEKLSVFADVFYASGKLSFNDVEDYLEWSVGVTAKVLQNGQISVGYNLIEVDTDRYNNVELEDGVFARIAFGF